MLSSITVSRRVEFSETDMAGIVHFSNYFKWMEAAEAALFREIDEELIARSAEEFRGWPRVRASADFSQPLRFGDTVEIHLFIKEIHSRAIRYFFRIYKVDGQERTQAAKGEMTTICAILQRETNDMQAASLADDFRAKIAEATPEAMKPLTPPASA